MSISFVAIPLAVASSLLNENKSVKNLKLTCEMIEKYKFIESYISP